MNEVARNDERKLGKHQIQRAFGHDIFHLIVYSSVEIFLMLRFSPLCMLWEVVFGKVAHLL